MKISQSQNAYFKYHGSRLILSSSICKFAAFSNLLIFTFSNFQIFTFAHLLICIMLDLKDIDTTWTLFLDRDGVINHEKEMDYVYRYNEFVFYDRVKDALKILSTHFGNIILVTNQRGVGRGLMSEEDLVQIHLQMLEDIKISGGRIDEIFYCTSTDNEHPNRKPNPGMAYLAQKKFPQINFNTSIIVGNNLSDMLFGRNAGMFTVHVRTTDPNITLPHELIDLSFVDLYEFASVIQTTKESLKY